MKKLVILLLAALCLAILLLAALCLPCTTACDDSDTTKENDTCCNLAVVYSGVNNNPVFDTTIQELVRLPAAADSAYSVILADGSPSVVCDGVIPSFVERGYSQVMLRRVHQSIAADIAGQIKTAVPDTAECDMASAISMALRCIHVGEDPIRTNLLVLYGSGISTSGTINLTATPVYQLDMETSVSLLKDALDWDMTNVPVVWYCCADTNGDQSPLSDRERIQLKDFYRALFGAMGCPKVDFRDDPPLDETYAYPLPVSVMETEETTSLTRIKVVEHNVKDENSDNLFEDGQVLAFPEDEIRFLPDSTQLADPSAAQASLAGVIEYMEEHQDFQLLICGTTTSAGEPDSCKAFSQQRADAVLALLSSDAGISPDRLHTLGCGWSSCLYVPDKTASGTLDETVAPQNRSVKLVDYSSETAVRIKRSLEEE